jgi:hypothetical protein
VLVSGVVPAQLPTSHSCKPSEQGVPTGCTRSTGQVVDVPVHTSGASQPKPRRHSKPATAVVQVPFAVPPASVEHARQSSPAPSPQALSQQTPSTQKPVAQVLPSSQLSPRAATAPPTGSASAASLQAKSATLTAASSARRASDARPRGVPTASGCEAVFGSGMGGPQ